MKDTIESTIQKGNKTFLAGNQIDAMIYYLNALKQSGALESIVKYVKKYKDNVYENQLMLQKLLSTKYHIDIVPGALPLFLIHVKNQMEEIEANIEYERFKKLILSKHPKTVAQTIDVFLDEFENPSRKQKELLLKVFMEHGMNYSLYEIDGFCNLRINARELTKFERSLDWKKTQTFTEIDAMTGYEFEDFIVDLFTKLGYVVEKRKRSREQGLDLLLLKHGERIAVQVKRYKRPVGNRAVQQAHAACVYHNCRRAIVVTNSTFTTPAKQLAARFVNVELWDREVIKEKIKRVWGTS
jgi:HJR/Mrr/RecB family endonuclease